MALSCLITALLPTLLPTFLPTFFSFLLNSHQSDSRAVPTFEAHLPLR